jgi:hypothetical protein
VPFIVSFPGKKKTPTLTNIAPPMGRDWNPFIYDSETGLLVPWYFYLRACEEAARSRRYGRRFSIAAIRNVEGQPDSLEKWLFHQLRFTDLVCRVSEGSYYALLVEADEEASSDVERRILKEFPTVSIVTANVPSEAKKFEQILGSLYEEWQTSAA